MVTLKNDVISRFPPRILHGKAGEEVKIISLHGHVFIVKGPGGNSFPAIADDLCGLSPKLEAEARAAQAELKVGNDAISAVRPITENAPSIQKIVKTRQAQQAPAPKIDQSQGTLF